MTKLTLSVRKETIEKAKKYAKKHNKSISKMIESYLESLASTGSGSKIEEISPFVKDLSIDMSLKENASKEYWDHLIEKHS